MLRRVMLPMCYRTVRMLRAAVPLLLACCNLAPCLARSADVSSGQPRAASAPATRDLPIATASGAAAALSLNGDWQATGAGSAWTTGECTFVQNRDYNPGGNSSQIAIASSHYRMDRAACCASCGSTDGCAAAVFRGAGCSPWASLCRGHCTFRTEEDLLHPVQATDNSSACIPTGKQPTPTITVNATVPGVSARLHYM